MLVFIQVAVLQLFHVSAEIFDSYTQNPKWRYHFRQIIFGIVDLLNALTIFVLRCSVNLGFEE